MIKIPDDASYTVSVQMPCRSNCWDYVNWYSEKKIHSFNIASELKLMSNFAMQIPHTVAAKAELNNYLPTKSRITY